jgi:hypothetical protein
MFSLRWLSSPDFWLLEQGRTPVGVVRRTRAAINLRTTAEEWRVAMGRRRWRLGWHLEFAREGEPEAVLRYFPRATRNGGRLEVSGGRRYRLRSPLLRADWRLAAAPGGEICRIAFRGRRDVPLDKHVHLSARAADEPLLPAVLLAASAAIVLHDEEVQGPGLVS